jgi:hypothetical protein
MSTKSVELNQVIEIPQLLSFFKRMIMSMTYKDQKSLIQINTMVF